MTTTATPTLAKTAKCQPGPTRRLLLVDDDQAMREILTEMVQGWAFAPTTAATFREARAVVATTAPFGLIVSDYHLPDGNGLEFRHWLKREALVQVPFLLISGGMARQPTVADDCEFLAKPFRMEVFRDRLERLCQSTAGDPVTRETAPRRPAAGATELR